MGWGIVYEDRVGKQQPVWAVYAPPVAGDNTRQAIQVCGTNNLGAGGANPVPEPKSPPPPVSRIGTPATPPPVSGSWEWKTTGWNYQDNPIRLRLGYIIGGTPTAGERHPDSYSDVLPVFVVEGISFSRVSRVPSRRAWSWRRSAMSLRMAVFWSAMVWRMAVLSLWMVRHSSQKPPNIRAIRVARSEMIAASIGAPFGWCLCFPV